MVAEYTLHQVLDLAIGTPEVGAVNFNILYSLLSLIIKRLEALKPLTDQLPEWQDFDTDRGHAIEGAPQEYLDSLETREEQRARDEQKKLSPTYHDLKSRLIDREKVSSSHESVSSSPRGKVRTKKKISAESEEEYESPRRSDISASVKSVKSILEKRSSETSPIQRSKEALPVKRSEESLIARKSSEAISKSRESLVSKKSKPKELLEESVMSIRRAKKQREISSEEEEEEREISSKESFRLSRRTKEIVGEEEELISKESTRSDRRKKLLRREEESVSVISIESVSTRKKKKITSGGEEEEEDEVRTAKRQRDIVSEDESDYSPKDKKPSKRTALPGRKTLDERARADVISYPGPSRKPVGYEGLPPIGKPGEPGKPVVVPPSRYSVSEDDKATAGNAVIMTKRSWLAIQRKVHMLEDQVDNLLKCSGSDDFISHMQKYAPGATATEMHEMMQKLNISRRIDNNEKIIVKLSELMDGLEEQMEYVSCKMEQLTEKGFFRTASAESLMKVDAHHEELKYLKGKVRDLEQQCLTLAGILQQLVSRDELQKVVHYLRDSLGVTVETLSQRLSAAAAAAKEPEDTDESEEKISIPEIKPSPGRKLSFEEGGHVDRIIRQIADIQQTLERKMDKEVFSELSGVPTKLINQIEIVKKSANFIETQRVQQDIQNETVTAIIDKLIEEGVDCGQILETKKQKEEDAKIMLEAKGIIPGKEEETQVARESFSVSGSQKESSKSVSGSEESFGESGALITKRVEDIERDVRDVQRKLERVMVSQAQAVTSTEDAGQMEEAKMKILELFESIEGISEQINQLVDDSMDKQKQLQKFSEALFQLHESKAEQEEVLLLKEEKADKMMVDNKVDHSLFETSLNEVHQELSSLEDKINYIDQCNQTTLSNLSENLLRKVDRSELPPLRDYINKKVKMLLIKIKKLQSVGGPEDGAGTRKQLLRKFHCVSCDKPVVVAGMGWTPHANPPPFPPSQSINPVTTYEIELVRQQKRVNLGKKSLFRPTASEMARSRRMELDAARAHQVGELGPSKENIENIPENVDTRYCGGSHTLTFPFQRANKQYGHLFTEIPEAKKEVPAEGHDGMFYKGRPLMEEKTGAAEEQLKMSEAVEDGGDVSEEAPSFSIPTADMLTASQKFEQEHEQPQEEEPDLDSKVSPTMPSGMGTAISATRVRSSPGSPAPFLSPGTPRKLSSQTASTPPPVGGVGSPGRVLSRTGSGMQARLTSSLSKMPSGTSSPLRLSGSSSVRSVGSISLPRSGTSLTARSPLPSTTSMMSRTGSGTARNMQSPSRTGSQERRKSSTESTNQEPPGN